FFQAEDGIRDPLVTGVQTCALPICCQERKNRDNENVHNALLFPPSASGRKWVLGSLNPYRSKRSMNDGMTPVATNSPTTLPFSTPLCSHLQIVCVVMVLPSILVISATYTSFRLPSLRRVN